MLMLNVWGFLITAVWKRLSVTSFKPLQERALMNQRVKLFPSFSTRFIKTDLFLACIRFCSKDQRKTTAFQVLIPIKGTKAMLQ